MPVFTESLCACVQQAFIKICGITLIHYLVESLLSAVCKLGATCHEYGVSRVRVRVRVRPLYVRLRLA